MTQKTYKQIQNEISKLQREAEQLLKKEAAEIAPQIREAIQTYGFTVADLFGEHPTRGGKASVLNSSKAGRTRNILPAKYADDRGNSWSGRGPRPAWFRESLASGKKPEDLLV